MWVKAFRYFGWKKFQCGTRRCLCRVFLPLAPAPQSGRLPPRPVNGRFAGLLLMRLQPMQTPGLGEIMSMKRGIVRGNGFPLLDKSQQQAEMFIFQARTFAPETRRWPRVRAAGSAQEGPGVPVLGAVLEALPFLRRRTDRPSRSPICFPRKSRALTAALATKTSRTGSWMSSGGGRAGTRGVVVSPAGSACDGPNKVLRVE